MLADKEIDGTTTFFDLMFMVLVSVDYLHKLAA